MKKKLSSFTEIANEWHPTRNGDLKPENFSFGSGKKIWWECSKDNTHEWQTTIDARTRNNGNGTNCPICLGKSPRKRNNFLITFPHIAIEWHPIRNGDLKPENFRPSSGQKFWWKCSKDNTHEWQTTIDARTRNNGNGTNCPICNITGTSRPEIRILTELFYIFEYKNIEWRYKIYGVEVDVFLKDYNIAIEYDGYYFHNKKIATDLKKNKILDDNKISLLRVREYPLKSVTSNDIIIRNELNKQNLNLLLQKIKGLVKTPHKVKFLDYIKKVSFQNSFEFNRYISYLPSPPPEYSLQLLYPIIANEWHTSKNGNLKPKNFTIGSDQKVWWKCPKGDDHEWQTAIYHRTKKNGNGTDCPFCSGMNVSKTNNLKFIFPKLASKWHPTKNSPLKPENVTSRSAKKVWWKCPKGDDHEWESKVTDQVTCPFCFGNKISYTNNLLSLFPKVASEWHPTKNGDLKSENYRKSSNIKVWWKCPKGEDHEWESKISNRTKKKPNNCPVCSGRKSDKNNNLLIHCPDLVKEWHPIKNQKLLPKNFKPGSHKKIWWRCSKNNNHEWQSSIYNRAKINGTGCPICYNKKRKNQLH